MIKITDLIKELPEQIGCYLFKAQKVVIYVGKSKNIKKRVESYYAEKEQDRKYFKIEHLTLIADSIDYILTKNEKEALILEFNLIKKYRPRFNIIFKDDKNYPYIFVNLNNNPRYHIVSGFKKNKSINFPKLKKELCFGPFINFSLAKELLSLLQSLYPLSYCNNRFFTIKKPCIYYQMGFCIGSCFKKINDDFYYQCFQKIIDFFDSPKAKNNLIKRLISEIKIAIKNLQFEKAEKIKNKISKINSFFDEQLVEFKDKLNRDFIVFCQKKDLLLLYFAIYRYGKLQIEKRKVLRINENCEKTLLEYLYLFYSNNLSPDYLFLNNILKTDDFKILFPRVKQVIPKIGKNKKILDWLEEKLLLFGKEKEEFLEELIYNRTGLEKKINLFFGETKKNLFNKIQIFDVSNIDQTLSTGGVATYENFSFNYWKSKKYKLKKNIFGDIYLMKDLLKKHFKKISENKNLLPTFIFVDGGSLQVKIVINLFKIKNINIPVAGLVKDNKHRFSYVYYRNKKYYFSSSEYKLKNFFTDMQNNAHKIANNYFSFLNRKSKFA